MTATESEPAYPRPRQTATNAPLLEAWRDGALALQRCGGCGHVFFYPRSVCPKCWGTDVTWFRSGGRGRIVSFSRIHRGLSAAFQAEVPIVLAEIAVSEGALMLARVVAADPLGIKSGTPVRLVPPPDAARYPLPTFTPE